MGLSGGLAEIYKVSLRVSIGYIRLNPGLKKVNEVE